MLTDYYILRRRHGLHIEQLYTPRGLYWYRRGINWRAVAAFFAGLVPLLPSLVYQINPAGGGIARGYVNFSSLAWLECFLFSRYVRLSVCRWCYWGYIFIGCWGVCADLGVRGWLVWCIGLWLGLAGLMSGRIRRMGWRGRFGGGAGVVGWRWMVLPNGRLLLVARMGKGKGMGMGRKRVD